MNRTELLDEILIEDIWAIMRRFTHEVMDEFELEGKLPIQTVMFSANVLEKYMNWVTMN